MVGNILAYPSSDMLTPLYERNTRTGRKESINQSINQSTYHSINQLINKSIIKALLSVLQYFDYSVEGAQPVDL